MSRTHITIRLSDEERERLGRLSESYGLNMSDFIREMTAWVEKTQPRIVQIIEPKAEYARTNQPV